MEDLQIIRQQAAQAAAELTEKAGLKAGDIFVVGCSSSEIIGGEIGHASSLEAAQAAYEGIQSVLAPKGIFLAAQCCEHLNRAIVLPAAAVKPWQQPVNVIPQPKAGGSFATTAWNRLENPAVLESIQADAGMDIGGTLIGMHLRPVAVPVRLSLDHIGSAILLCARTRPKYIGGGRAVYAEL
ncbi:MAG TPA: TIGR01440 family protein [Candidatus Anaerofilum excrementigallinarum]|nr:TIGR01440 family protein [Candidatus Anaerofilum excrementigallinarum]